MDPLFFTDLKGVVGKPDRGDWYSPLGDVTNDGY